MTEELSQDRQRLIRRYMEESVGGAEPTGEGELPDPWRRETIVDPAPLVDLEPFPAPHPRLELVRWWIAAGVHRHPQVRLALALIVLAVAVGWLVARG